MIVRNEAHQLAECLSPIANLFDELVIVDTGSRDETIEVARRFTSNVFHFIWCDDFSAARNECLRQAHGDWVFWLDADDRISPDNIERLRKVLNQRGDQPKVFTMDTVCAGPDADEPAVLITHARLFKRHPQLAWRGRVHEQLHPAPASLGHEICPCDVRIEHVGYQNAVIRQRKLQRDLRLLRMDFAIDDNDPSTLLHLGQILAHLGKTAEAWKHLLRLLSAQNCPVGSLRRVFVLLAIMSLRESKFPKVIALTDKARQLFPDDAHLSYLRAEALYELDEYAAAESALREIIASQATQSYHAGTPVDIQTLLAPRSLAEVLRIQRRFDEAERVLLAVSEQYPRDLIVWHSLGRIYIDQRQFLKLEFACERLRSCANGESLARLLMVAWKMRTCEWMEAEGILNDLIGQEPHNVFARLMRATCLTRRQAPVAERLQAWRDVLRLQPEHAEAAATIPKLEVELQSQVGTWQPAWSTPVVFNSV